MPDDRSKPTVMVSDIISHIDRMIATGQLNPGERLIESELTALLGVGRAPLREAIRILAGDGVLDLSPNRGARVRSVSGRRIIEMHKIISVLTYMELEDFMRAEDFAVHMAELEALNDRIAQALEQHKAHDLVNLTHEYGVIVARNSGNAYLLEILARIHVSHFMRHVLNYIDYAEIAATAAIFAPLTVAIRDKDIASARAILAGRTQSYSAELKRSIGA